MIKINIKDNLHNALTLNEIEWIPCTTFSTVILNKIIKKMNITYKEGHENSDKMMKLATLGYEYAGLEGITIPLDFSLEAEAMGCQIELDEEIHITKIINTPFDELTDIDIPEEYIYNGRFQIIEKTIEKIHEDYYNKEIPVIATMLGPFTLLSQIYKKNIDGIIKRVNTNLVDIEDAINNITYGLLEEIDFYNELNVDVITIYEPNATPSLLEPDMFKKMLKPFLEELSNNMKVPSVLHICGDTTNNLENMMTCGFNGISIDSEVDILEAKQLQAEINSKTRICGNVSTEETLSRKRTKDVINETLEILKNGVDILSPSCMISPDTPLKNVKAMIEARNKFCEIE